MAQYLMGRDLGHGVIVVVCYPDDRAIGKRCLSGGSQSGTFARAFRRVAFYNPLPQKISAKNYMTEKISRDRRLHSIR
jgi:hypothetical protein